MTTGKNWKKGVRIWQEIGKWSEFTQIKGTSSAAQIKAERRRIRNKTAGGREGWTWLICNQNASPISRVVISSSLSCSSVLFTEPHRLAAPHNTYSTTTWPTPRHNYTSRDLKRLGQNPLILLLFSVTFQTSSTGTGGFKKRHCHC